MRRPFLNYYGGKFTARTWITSRFPEHKIFVDVFGGGGNIILSKTPSKVDVYNDIDSEIHNLFSVARGHGDALKTSLILTPYSREEYNNVRGPTLDRIERARRTIVKSFMGIGDSIHNKTGFRNSTSSNASPSKTFKSYVEYFDFFVDRMRGIFLENLDFRECIKKYDTEETLFYLDPPYIHSTRMSTKNYGHEMTNNDHIEMVEIIKSIKGNFILSGYENDLYPKEWVVNKKESNTQTTKRTECLYMKNEDVENGL
jgi:DNA adenine methylase